MSLFFFLNHKIYINYFRLLGCGMVFLSFKMSLMLTKKIWSSRVICNTSWSINLDKAHIYIWSLIFFHLRIIKIVLLTYLRAFLWESNAAMYMQTLVNIKQFINMMSYCCYHWCYWEHCFGRIILSQPQTELYLPASICDTLEVTWAQGQF